MLSEHYHNIIFFLVKMNFHELNGVEVKDLHKEYARNITYFHTLQSVVVHLTDVSYIDWIQHSPTIVKKTISIIISIKYQ